ncbi:hypothetical protein Poly59_43180 [Rubripirellula reticaptiva]|uniref:Uncharacterized protein n=1 Tax=Rubripirellula reticaptiva TaxID=2528013 RepID=A0A5C6EMV9_9BACT|nr:hypothetical protein Poly59_43180 [Rubripirellula reticaptiva]
MAVFRRSLAVIDNGGDSAHAVSELQSHKETDCDARALKLNATKPITQAISTRNASSPNHIPQPITKRRTQNNSSLSHKNTWRKMQVLQNETTETRDQSELLETFDALRPTVQGSRRKR